MNKPSARYLVFSFDFVSGVAELGEYPESQTLANISEWLQGCPISDAALEVVSELRVGELYILTEGSHGGYDCREIHFIRITGE